MKKLGIKHSKILILCWILVFVLTVGALGGLYLAGEDLRSDEEKAQEHIEELKSKDSFKYAVRAAKKFVENPDVYGSESRIVCIKYLKVSGSELIYVEVSGAKDYCFQARTFAPANTLLYDEVKSNSATVREEIFSGEDLKIVIEEAKNR